METTKKWNIPIHLIIPGFSTVENSFLFTKKDKSIEFDKFILR